MVFLYPLGNALPMLPGMPWLLSGKQQKIWSLLSPSLSQQHNWARIIPQRCLPQCLTDTQWPHLLWLLRTEKLNPGSVVNWGQVEMIYDLRNVLTLYTIIQTTVSIGPSKLWNQIEIGIFQRIRSSRGRSHGRRQAGGQMSLCLNKATFSSHTLDQLPSKSWFIVIQRRDGIGLCQGNFICLESDRKKKNKTFEAFRESWGLSQGRGLCAHSASSR